MKPPIMHRAAAYIRDQYWELPANVLEGITLVLLVFVQDVAFKQSVIVCALLLFISLALHGLAYRAGQCQVWPKVIELTAPVPFVAMIPAAYLAYVPTQKSAFITINMWFAVVEVVFILTGRNFMMEYMQDWNPKEVWGTPLLQQSANATAGVWILCQLIMAGAQALAVAFKLSVDSGNNVAAAVFVCYIMQLLPLLFAIVFTFAYPGALKKRWGYVEGVRATCYPPPHTSDSKEGPANGGMPGSCAGGAGVGGLAGSSNSQDSLCSTATTDVMVCISPGCDGSKGSCSSTGGSSAGGSGGGGSQEVSSSRHRYNRLDPLDSQQLPASLPVQGLQPRQLLLPQHHQQQQHHNRHHQQQLQQHQ